MLATTHTVYNFLDGLWDTYYLWLFAYYILLTKQELGIQIRSTRYYWYTSESKSSDSTDKAYSSNYCVPWFGVPFNNLSPGIHVFYYDTTADNPLAPYPCLLPCRSAYLLSHNLNTQTVPSLLPRGEGSVCVLINVCWALCHSAVIVEYYCNAAIFLCPRFWAQSKCYLAF